MLELEEQATDTPAEPARRRSALKFAVGALKVTGAVVLGTALVGVTATAGVLVGLAASFQKLPDVRSLKTYVPSQTSEIFDVNGELIVRLHGEANREVVKLDEVSPYMKLAVLAIEDSHFYQHPGINAVGVGRAALGSLTGGLGSAGGGSTITMQLVKNLFLTPERTLSRKMSEAVLSVRLEQVFDKDETLELYLNQVYWGHNLYGVQTAAESYFLKSASKLDLAESALLAGMLQAPEGLSPFSNYQGSKIRQKTVLNRMAELGWISSAEAEAAHKQPLKIGWVTSFKAVGAPAVSDAIEGELIERYGRDMVLRGGLRVQSTIDMNLQRDAQEIVDTSIGQLAAWGHRVNQGALVTVDSRTGYVKAMVGGVNAKRGQFNRAVQARRQPGSAFKPFVYYAALATGRYGPGTVLQDTPITFWGGPRPYKPRNYDNTFMGAISFQQSLAQSRNVSTVKLADKVRIQRVIDAAYAAGIRQELDPVLSLSLGSVDLSPLEMAAAYAAFANGGYRVEPTLLLKVSDARGKVLHAAQPQKEQTLDPWAVASLNHLMLSVVRGGTGKRAQLPDGRQVAGKTGTTSDFRDAWFVGHVPQMATAVWIGNDDYSPMTRGTAGGVAVAPIFRRFMTRAVADKRVEYFPLPNKFPAPRP
ncbi:MAG: transglycosylase domain-containing protein [Cyanobacteria bacterium J06642_2]